MATNTPASSQPPHRVSGPLRARRHISPSVWIMVRSAGALKVMDWSSPRRASRKALALLPGWIKPAWAASAATWDSSWAAWPRGVARHSPAASKRALRRRESIRRVGMLASSLRNPLQFGLLVVPGADVALPADLVAAVSGGFPGMRVGLALVFAGLVLDDLGGFSAACGQTGGHAQQDDARGLHPAAPHFVPPHFAPPFSPAATSAAALPLP